MRFPAGNAGFVVVIAAVLATVIVGYVFSGDTTTESRTEFQHTADITGLFNTSIEPEYLDYSPAANWTGFRTGGSYWMQGVSYAASDTATPYIVPQEDRTAVYDGQITGDDNPYSSSQLFFRSWATGAQVINPKFVSLASVVEGMELADDIKILDIWTEDGGPIITGYQEFFPSSPAPTSQRYLATDPDTRHATIYLNDEIGRTVLYDGTGKAIDTLALSDIRVFYGGDIELTGDFTYQGTRDLPLIYMDASQGVAITGNTVSWTNGYTISGFTIAFSGSGSTALTFSLDGKTVRLAVISGEAIMTVDGSEVMSQEFGGWTRFAFDFDLTAGTVAFLPIAEWTSFTDWQAAAVGQVADLGASGTIDGITFYRPGDGHSIRLGITSTTVFMDTSKVVLKDPAIDIQSYWPADDARIQFSGFAYYGSSVTINGVEYPVADGLITIDGQTVELSNLTVTWLDGRTTATIGQRGYDLGETTSHVVSFGGIWYFAASYWSAQEVTHEVYSWTTGIFGLGSQAAVLVYIGILMLGTAILHRAQGLHLGDLLIIACAGAVGYVIMGMAL